ncbi:MAG: hypothetical protein GX333_01060 [Syntrophomonadaceae bacterium]|nr:hypothetical protein [Syntrophomonadaceae bacterium]
MRLRNFKNLPIFNESNAEIVGVVDKAVIGDNYNIAYLVVILGNNSKQMLDVANFTLADNAIIINDLSSIKSYMYGEELSIYDKKLGDLVFDMHGQELGVVSDFVVCPQTKKVCAIEVSAGVLQDLWAGRKDVDINNVLWKSIDSGIVN